MLELLYPQKGFRILHFNIISILVKIFKSCINFKVKGCQLRALVFIFSDSRDWKDGSRGRDGKKEDFIDGAIHLMLFFIFR